MIGAFQQMNRIGGAAECVVRGAEPEGFLNHCSAAGITVLAVRRQDAAELVLTLRLRELSRAQAIALRCQCELEPVRHSRAAVLRQTVLRRILPVLCLSVLCAVLAWSRCYIWEMDVSGNETVSSSRILNALEDCGVSPGCFWPGLTSDNLRSELLVRLPELAWATVNIHGSRAEVIVRERVPKPQIFDEDAPTDLIARCTGFVTKVQTLNGTALVKPGCAVATGELLIEGRADSAFSGEREVHALGAVQADTYHELTALLPSEQQLRGERGAQKTRWALELGGKRINFYRNSSISDDRCDKIISVWECKHEGLFILPLRLIRIRTTEYTPVLRPRDGNLARRAMEQLLHAALAADLGTNGTAEEEKYSCCLRNGSISVCLRAKCSEEIALEQIRIQEGYQ